jgi:hypothetical protein
MIRKYRSGDPDVVPNARSFNAAISAYAKCDSPGAAQQAEHLLNQMDGLYMSGLEEAKPNSFNYNSLISAWANCNDEGSAQRAAEILERMEQCYAYGDVSCKPTTVSFNAVIDAYAKSGLPDAAERAEDVLIRMEKLYQEGGDVKPNTRSFNSVMNAWAKSGRDDAALKAQDLLEYMQRLYKEGNNAVRPDAHSFCTVINGTWMLLGGHGRGMFWFRTCSTNFLTVYIVRHFFLSLCAKSYDWKGRACKKSLPAHESSVGEWQQESSTKRHCGKRCNECLCIH